MKSANLKEKTGDQKGVAHLHHNIARVYFNQNQYDTSLEYYQKCEHYYSNNKDTAELVEIWSNKASVYIAQSKYDTANTLLNQVLSLLEQFPNPTVALKSQMNLADIYLKKENYPKALELFEAALEAAQGQDDYLSIISSYNFLGLIYFHLNDYKTSIRSYQEALNLSQELDILYEQGIALYGLYETNKYTGNIARALDCYQQYTSIKDSLYNVEIAIKLATMQAEQENLRQENEIKELKLKNKNIALANASKTKQLYGILAVVGLSLVLGILMWGYSHQQQQALQHQQKMKKMLGEQEIKILNAVVVAQQQERNYLAREVHDVLGNSLAILRMQYEAMDDLGNAAERRKKYLEIEVTIDKMSTQLRDITHELYTGEQFSFDLYEELELLVSRVSSGPKLDVVLHYMEHTVERPRHIDLVLYRVVQEALSNIMSHAQATKATVQISQTDAEVLLMIEDNGRGFDFTLQAQGIGLSSMEERVKSVKGSFDVDSTSKNGTTIVVEIPID